MTRNDVGKKLMLCWFVIRMHSLSVGHGHSGHDDNKYDDLHRGHVDKSDNK